ncbi:MAG: NAD-glutamate dehydrogenase domain-containing protein [Myxococcota bacterium]
MTVDSTRANVPSRVLSQLKRTKLPADLDAALFTQFVKVTVPLIRGPFLAQHPPKQVLGYLEAAFRFALVRTEDQLQVELRSGPSRGVASISHMADQPFIVDTIRLFFRSSGAEYRGGFNVIFNATRDADGRLVGIGGDDGVAESLAFLEFDGGELGSDLDAQARELHHRLELARATVRDFAGMTGAVQSFIDRCEALAADKADQKDAYEETASFLKWLLRENFVYMGARAGGQAMGTEALAGSYAGDPGGAWMAPHAPGMVHVRKSMMDSPVHREGRIDEILVRLGDGSELFLRGLFTYRAVTQSSRHVPVLRTVLADILERDEAAPGSFRFKGLTNVFDMLPTEFLFTTAPSAIAEMLELVFDSEQQREVGVSVLTQGDDSAFCLVCMPRGQYSEELRRELEDHISARLGTTHAEHGLYMGRYETVLLHFYLTDLTPPSSELVSELTHEIRVMATPWVNRLWTALEAHAGEARADYLVDTYGHAFPEAWMRKNSVERAIVDIENLERLSGATSVLADVYEVNGEIQLRLYQSENVYLTDILPVLDNLGLTVASSEVTHINSRGGALSFDTFVLSVEADQRDNFWANAPLLTEALPRIFDGSVDDDPLNGLILASGLTWKAVAVLRAYTHYQRQLQISLAAPSVRAVLLANPMTCAAAWNYFVAKFDPELTGDRAKALAKAEEKVVDLLNVIRTHDEYLVFAGLRSLINATLRTNAYRTDRKGDYLSFKFRCSDVRDMKGERPMYEIYVHDREVEGVHMRFGPVARGGLRWSDRADYRTEVLGLVTTQQVKNVVIVPEGSKGGFFLRQPERDRGARRQQADRLYKTFIRGLLDVTDNVVDSKVVPPPRVVRHDGDDPYLVVAADKGTAHLSDTANGISLSYGFWLGDAFASGGSNGYDHKGVGITARGAWVLVRRHFAEMGKDPYTQPFTAMGVGDMGGDVFGNGLIETDQTRLLAAFNHMHIFIDPDPDTAKSYAERKRLFEVAGRQAGWDHYDTSVLSEGGGVYDRASKSVDLSDKAREMLGLPAEGEVGPDEVIRAILKMDVDLFWSGGIGTYVKASHETHADADDAANNRSRISADELRARVVGEGANLSFTQAGRIEAGERGVRLNTDFIDNSAGVDMSDHEVNLKILLSMPQERGELTEDARNTLLHEMTEEVAGLVLANNEAQGRQISRDVIRSQQDIFPFGRAIAFIEKIWGRTREQLNLPSDEVLALRAAEGKGLTRPELSTISSHVKRYVFRELMASGQAKELLGYDEMLRSYFPKRILADYPQDVVNHMLADEIAMTVATTRLLGDAGVTYVPLTVETTGRGMWEVADAYFRAQRLARAQEVRSALEELRMSVDLTSLYQAWVQVDAGTRDVVAYWLAATNRRPTDAELAEMDGAVDEVYELQAEAVAKSDAEDVSRMLEVDVPAEVAHIVVKARYLDGALMAWATARKLGMAFREVVVRQLATGRATRLQEVINAITSRAATGQWEPIALQILGVRFRRLLRAIVIRGREPVGDRSVDLLEPVLAEGELSGVRGQIDTFVPGDASEVDVSTLLVLEERVQGAVDRLKA